MKTTLIVLLVGIVAVSRSTFIGLVPKPFCLCGSVYKLQTYPINVQSPLLSVSTEPSECGGLTRVQLGDPRSKLCHMQQGLWPTPYSGSCPRPYPPPICRPLPSFPRPPCDCGVPCGCRL